MVLTPLAFELLCTTNDFKFRFHPGGGFPPGVVVKLFLAAGCFFCFFFGRIGMEVQDVVTKRVFKFDAYEMMHSYSEDFVQNIYWIYGITRSKQGTQTSCNLSF